MDNNLFILVRNLPTKQNKIWETLVNVKKIYDALTWLKLNNILYKDINLPNYNGLQNLITNMGNEGVVIEKINDDEVSVNDIIENIPKSAHNKAMISQRSPSDEYYQQFTIHCLNEPRKNAKDTELYQMLQIENDPINNFEDLQLDLKCFPHLFPYAMNGQYRERKIKLTPSEYVKSQLMSMNSSFHKDPQYLFFLLHESNLRALISGIYHKLNTINIGTKTKLTASKCLELINKNELEGNLTTIFANLRNTSQYWLNPRSDIEAMITWYGPVTFFLTLSPGLYN